VSNLLVFGFAALGCEWLVHQTQYLIQYGSRFGTVMAESPHRLYMGQAGLVLLITTAFAVTGLVVLLARARQRQQRVLRRLPPGIQRYLADHPLRLDWAAVVRTGLVLALCQMALYLMQENLESAAVSSLWPGLWVFLAPQHLTVIPLHVLAALSSSALLWTAAGLLRRSDAAGRIMRTLLALFDRRSGVPARLAPPCLPLPSLRPRSGELGLRSPPLVAV
jgi:hypothetical protein